LHAGKLTRIVETIGIGGSGFGKAPAFLDETRPGRFVEFTGAFG
jgi:hypothetical protein